MPLTITIPQVAIAAFCQRNHIRRMAVFGSALRPDFRPDSDLDVLVEFDSGYTPGLITIGRLRRELGELFGREVDLRTPAALSDYFRDDVLAIAQTIYERG